MEVGNGRSISHLHGRLCASEQIRGPQCAGDSECVRGSLASTLRCRRTTGMGRSPAPSLLARASLASANHYTREMAESVRRRMVYGDQAELLGRPLEGGSVDRLALCTQIFTKLRVKPSNFARFFLRGIEATWAPGPPCSDHSDGGCVTRRAGTCRACARSWTRWCCRRVGTEAVQDW